LFFQAVNNLKEMGFQEEEIIMALKATGNNQEAAVSLKHPTTCIQGVRYYLCMIVIVMGLCPFPQVISIPPPSHTYGCFMSSPQITLTTKYKRKA